MDPIEQQARPLLHTACLIGDEENVVKIICSGADLNEVDFAGCSAVQLASAVGHFEIVKILLKNGAKPEIQDSTHGNASLHEASWRGFSSLVKLLSSSSTINIQNHGGFTPLHLACQAGHNQCTRELLIAGANPNLVNTYGDTALHTSVRYGHAGVCRILLSARAEADIQNKNGDTALHISSAMHRKKLTKILLSSGCNSSLINNQGETPLDICKRKEFHDVIHVLQNPPNILTPMQRDEMRASKFKMGGNSGPSNNNAQQVQPCTSKQAAKQLTSTNTNTNPGGTLTLKQQMMALLSSKSGSRKSIAGGTSLQANNTQSQKSSSAQNSPNNAIVSNSIEEELEPSHHHGKNLSKAPKHHHHHHQQQHQFRSQHKLRCSSSQSQHGSKDSKNNSFSNLNNIHDKLCTQRDNNNSKSRIITTSDGKKVMMIETHDGGGCGFGGGACSSATANKNDNNMTKVKVNNNATEVDDDDEPKWSPYGCHHIHSNSGAFPKPNIDSLPKEPLTTGELYYLDLAGNIHKGPMGVSEGCYCNTLLSQNQNSQSMLALNSKNNNGPSNSKSNLNITSTNNVNNANNNNNNKVKKSSRRHHHSHHKSSKQQLHDNDEPPPSQLNESFNPNVMLGTGKGTKYEDQLKTLTSQLSKIHMDTQAQLSSLHSILNERLKDRTTMGPETSSRSRRTRQHDGEMNPNEEAQGDEAGEFDNEDEFNENKLKEWVKQYRRFRKEISKNPKTLNQANELLASASALLSTRLPSPPPPDSETDSGL